MTTSRINHALAGKTVKEIKIPALNLDQAHQISNLEQQLAQTSISNPQTCAPMLTARVPDAHILPLISLPPHHELASQSQSGNNNYQQKAPQSHGISLLNTRATLPPQSISENIFSQILQSFNSK
ncbi:MAG TPA: hypothetical protein VHA13_03380 [Gammaproteobacteria bacterium]|nr:hypothetical protein [Gammaproteobacteria bacterium]